MIDDLFKLRKKMRFKHIESGVIELTDNMFFLMFPQTWEFVGYETAEESE